MSKSLRNLPTLFLLLFLIFAPHGIISSGVKKQRVKRNLGQLVSLVVNETPYSFLKLGNYGNWCGKGGDRMGDGSTTDGCDLCCKNHDLCYFRSRMAHSGCTPLFTTYSYRKGERNPDVHLDGLTSSEERALGKSRRLPSCNSRANEAPSCKEAICQCDMELVLCLKKEPCDPSMVTKKSRHWWLPG